MSHIIYRWRGPRGGFIYDECKPAWPADELIVTTEQDDAILIERVARETMVALGYEPDRVVPGNSTNIKEVLKTLASRLAP